MNRNIILLLTLLCGCVASRDRVIVATGTVIGVEIAQNPATQLYQVRLGYDRAEAAVLSTNKVNVIMELRYGGIFSLSEASVYQRLAVGDLAVAQPGAFLMFAKDKSGQIDPVAAVAVASMGQPANVADTGTVAVLAPLARAFSTASDKSPFEAAARKFGFGSFAEFLTSRTVTKEQALLMAAELKAYLQQ